MGLGDKAAALALSERAIAANPIEKDAKTVPAPIDLFARVAARMGEPDPPSLPYRSYSRYPMKAH
jgi:hypothetical protein